MHLSSSAAASPRLKLTWLQVGKSQLMASVLWVKVNHCIYPPSVHIPGDASNICFTANSNRPMTQAGRM
jgi:hypothetical protein